MTGTTSNLSLYDKFHEGNTKKKREEILRRVGHIPELNGIINTQKVEQINSWMAKNIYFFDMMRPLHHLVISRSMILYKNAEINLARLKHAKFLKVLRHMITLAVSISPHSFRVLINLQLMKFTQMFVKTILRLKKKKTKSVRVCF